MALPLLPILALLGGAGYEQYRRGERRQMINQQVSDIFGQAPQGDMPGSGLLANPTDLNAQLQAATGLFQIQDPRISAAGGQMLQGLLQQSNAQRLQNQQFQTRFAADQAQQVLENQLEAEALQRKRQTEARDFGLSERKRVLGEEATIRQEYESNLGEFAAQQRAFNAAISGLQGGSGFDAIANVINFMKTLDPRSIVTDREGDQVVSAQGAFGAIAQQVNSAIKGEGFNDASRRSIAQTLLRQIMPAWKTATQQREFFANQVQRQELEPGAVFGGLGINFDQPVIPQALQGPALPQGIQQVQRNQLPNDLQPVNQVTNHNRRNRRGR